jgi:hypothetical protein
MSDPLTQRERVQAIEGVERYVTELSRMARWLADSGCDAESIMVEDAARNMAAAGFILNAPIAARVPGLRAEALLQAVDGRHHQAG